LQESLPDLVVEALGVYFPVAGIWYWVVMSETPRHFS